MASRNKNSSSPFPLVLLLLVIALPVTLLALKNPIKFKSSAYSRAIIPPPPPPSYTVCPRPAIGCTYVAEAGLRQAISDAPYGSTINLLQGTYRITQILLFGPDYYYYPGMFPTKNLTFVGPGAILDGSSTLNILFSYSQDTITLKSLTLKNATQNAINLGGPATLNLSGVTISNTVAASIITNSTNNATPIVINVNNSIFQSNVTGPLIHGAVTSMGYNTTLNINNSIFYGNKYGIFTYNAGNTLNIKNTIFAKSVSAGLTVQGGTSANYTLYNNLFWSNTNNCSGYMYNLCNVNDTLWNIDPLFQSAPTNFQLQAKSQAIDAGTGLDRDGTKADIGAYGGLGVCDLNPSFSGCSSIIKF